MIKELEMGRLSGWVQCNQESLQKGGLRVIIGHSRGGHVTAEVGEKM